MEENEQDSDWVLIHSPLSSGAAKLIGDDSNSLVIKDDFFSESSPAFPPGNHEDLPIGSPRDGNRHLSEPEPEPEPEAEPLTPPSDSDDSVRMWKRLQFEVLRARILQIVHKVRKRVACRVGLCSFAWTAGGVAAVVLFIGFLRRRVLLSWRRRVEINSSNENLKLLIREKDEKINQLLLQIAQMNEALRAPRKVPVIQVK